MTLNKYIAELNCSEYPDFIVCPFFVSGAFWEPHRHRLGRSFVRCLEIIVIIIVDVFVVFVDRFIEWPGQAAFLYRMDTDRHPPSQGEPELKQLLYLKISTLYSDLVWWWLSRVINNPQRQKSRSSVILVLVLVFWWRYSRPSLFVEQFHSLVQYCSNLHMIPTQRVIT